MSLLSGLFRPASSSGERALTAWGSWTTGNRSDAGVTVNEDTVSALAAVWACETLIADSIATMPTDVYTRSGDTRRQIPAPSWIENPNPVDDEISFETQRVLSMLRGNAYILLVREGAQNYAPILERWVLDPARVSVRKGTNKVPVYFYDGQQLPAGSVQHIAVYKRPGSLTGMSPIQDMAQTYGISLAADKYAAGFLGNGANPSGVLQIPQLPAEANQDVIDRLREQFMGRHSGSGNAGKPIVLQGGTTWQQTSVNPDDAQLLETRKFQRSEIASIYRVPPHMIGDVERSTSWGTGIEQQGIGFVTYTLLSWLTRIERADSALLPRPRFVKKNIDALVRGDIATRYGAYTAGRNGGWFSVNEIRELEDLPPIDGGDTYLTPLNMSTGASNDGPIEPSDPAAA